MFQEYKGYIENIRNSLVQNDVQLDIVELDTYEDVFYYALNLEQVLWFYQIMGIGGSEFNIKSPYILTECYKEKVRQIAYKDFIQTIEGIRALGERYRAKKENSVKEEKINLDTLEDKEIDLFEEEDDNKEEIALKADKDDSIDDLLDFLNSFESTVPSESIEEEKISPRTFLDVVQSYSNSDSDMVQLVQSEGDVIHGIFIDEWVKENTVKTIQSESNLKQVHGIFIDEWTKPEVSIEENTHGVFIDEWVKPSIDVVTSNEVHGLYIDEWVKPERKSIKYNADEDTHGIFIDEWVKPIKHIPSESDYIEEDFFNSDFEEDYSTENQQIRVEDIKSKPDKKEERVIAKGQRDISDSIQDVTNKLLTEGKKMFINQVKKFQQ